MTAHPLHSEIFAPQFAVESNSDRWKTEISWLVEHYGPIGERWDYNGGLFFFKTGKDKIVFIIAQAS